MTFNFPNYKNYSYENYAFDFNDKRWKNYLESEGFVVIKNSVNPTSCSIFKDNLWKTVKCLSDVDLDKVENRKWSKNYPLSLHGGMYNIGHTKTQWIVRKRCKYIFQDLWNDNDLITSFDKFTFHPKERTYKKSNISSWIHSDQSYYNEIKSYQGLLCLSKNNNYNSGGFICIPGSHKSHKQICETDNQKTKKDWVKLSDDFKEKYVNSNNILKVRNNIGDFIIWNSKVIHSGFAPINKENERYDRVVIYVCMRPRKEANKKILERRIKAFKEKRSTTHNPVRFNLFEKNLGRYSDLSYEDIMKRLNDANLLANEINKELI